MVWKKQANKKKLMEGGRSILGSQNKSYLSECVGISMDQSWNQLYVIHWTMYFVSERLDRLKDLWTPFWYKPFNEP